MFSLVGCCFFYSWLLENLSRMLHTLSYLILTLNAFSIGKDSNKFLPERVFSSFVGFVWFLSQAKYADPLGSLINWMSSWPGNNKLLFLLFKHLFCLWSLSFSSLMNIIWLMLTLLQWCFSLFHWFHNHSLLVSLHLVVLELQCFLMMKFSSLPVVWCSHPRLPSTLSNHQRGW